MSEGVFKDRVKVCQKSECVTRLRIRGYVAQKHNCRQIRSCKFCVLDFVPSVLLLGFVLPNKNYSVYAIKWLGHQLVREMSAIHSAEQNSMISTDPPLERATPPQETCLHPQNENLPLSLIEDLPSPQIESCPPPPYRLSLSLPALNPSPDRWTWTMLT